MLVLIVAAGSSASAAEPLPLSTSYWQSPAFQKAFNGSYRIEARIEPPVSTEERGLLVEVQKLMETGQRKSALAKLDDSSLTKDSAALRFNLGNLHFEEGEIDEAIEAYESAIEDYPSFRRAHRNLAMALVRKDEMEEALPPLIEAIRLGDSEGATYGLLGYVRLQRGDWASALQAYRMAQLSEPDVPEWKAGVAQALQNLNLRDEAVALLDEVIRLRPEVASYSVLQASILIELGEREAAVKALELPRRLDILEPDGLLQLADLYLRQGLVQDADGAIGEAFEGEKQPELDRVLSVTAAAMAQREWELAGTLIERATPEEGDPPRELRRISARWKIESDSAPEEGAAELAALIKEDPTDGDSLMALGKHRAAAGQPGEAELIFEQATAVESVAPEAWIQLARLRVDESRFGAALVAIDKALAIRPSEELNTYREALARLADAAG